MEGGRKGEKKGTFEYEAISTKTSDIVCFPGGIFSHS